MSKIPWTEKTTNPFVGCSPVSEGCEHCYAAAFAHRGLCEMHRGLTEMHNGRARWTGEVNVDLDILRRAVKRKKPTTFFVGSMGDIFHGGILGDELIEMLRIVADATQHRFQLLTKRPDRIWLFLKELLVITSGRVTGDGYGLYGVVMGAIHQGRIALGVSVENQQRADERIPTLLTYWPGRTFVSVEPMLGPVSFDGGNDNYRRTWLGGSLQTPYHHVDQVIVGCESGRGARPTRLEWVRQLRDQCVAAGIPFFLKQLRGYPCELTQYPQRERPYKIGKIDGVATVDSGHAASWHPSLEGGGALIHKPLLDERQWLQPLWESKEASIR